MKRSSAQILITGTYRTGSEYLSNLIGLNKEVSSSMYRVNAYRFGLSYDRDKSLENALKYLIETDKRLTERYGMRLDTNQVLKASRGNISLSSLYNCIMDSLYINGEKSIWAEKNQLVWRELGRFTSEMPNGKGILLIRDPRSVLVSFKKYTIAEEPLYLESVFNCLDAMRCGLEWINSSTNKVLVVKYEDLVANPIQWYRKICTFMGAQDVNISAKELEEASYTDAYGKTWNSNSSFEENKTGFDVRAAVDRWKDQISGEDIELCEMVCGEYMEAFEYSRTINSIDKSKCYERASSSEIIKEHMIRWLETGEGIQKFPLDPLDKKTWEK